jgi:hypothetical protein
MFRDVVLFVINLFVVEPFQAEINARLAKSQAPQAVISQVRSCASTALPILVDRASADPWWGITTILRVRLGTTPPEALLIGAAPSCGPAMQAARSYLAANPA